MVLQRLTLGQGAQSALRNGTRLLGSYWVEALLRLVYVAAIARTLGADQFGIWSYTLAIYTLLLGVLTLGLDTQIPLRLGRARNRIVNPLRTSFTLQIIVLSAATLMLTAVGFLTETGTTRIAMLVSIIALWGRGISFFARWAFVGLERAQIVFRISVILRLTEVLVGLAFLFSGAGIVTLIAVHAVSWVAEGLISIWLLTKDTNFFSGRTDPRLMKVIVARGLPLGAAGGLKQWLMAGPIVLVKVFVGDLAIVGQFALAQQVAVIAATSIRAFYLASLPILGRASKRSDTTGAWFGRTTGTASVVLFGAAAAVAYWLGPPFAAFAFGPEFQLVGTLFAPFMIIAGLMLAPVGYTQILAAKSIYWPDVVAGLCGALVLAVLMPWLCLNWGVWGAVVATTCAWLVTAIVAITLCRRIG